MSPAIRLMTVLRLLRWHRSDMALLNFSNEPAPLVEPEPQVVLPVPPASVVTGRRDGPTSGKRSGASSWVGDRGLFDRSAAIVASVMYFQPVRTGLQQQPMRPSLQPSRPCQQRRLFMTVKGGPAAGDSNVGR